MPIVSSISRRLIKVFLFTIILSSCYDEDATEPILTFGSAEKGAYPFLTEEKGRLLINLLQPEEFYYEFKVGLIGEDYGEKVSEYIVFIDYRDINKQCGAIDQELFRFSKEDFMREDEDYASTPSIRITLSKIYEVIPWLSEDHLKVGDQFDIHTRLILENGTEIKTAPISPYIYAPRSGRPYPKFGFNIPVNCPSDLSGTYDYVADLDRGGWAAGTVSGTVDIVANGGGSYDFSDWSFGGYQQVYGCCTPGGDFDFTEVCRVVKFNTDVIDDYGDNWKLVVDIPDPNTLTIHYDNYTYANSYEAGFVTIDFPEGVPFTLAE